MYKESTGRGRLEGKRKGTGSAALGRYLAARRFALGLSYRELGAKRGRAASTVQAWEQGKRMPGLDDLFALAGVLGAPMEELLDLAAAPAR